jgi:hypothetical protein
MRTNVKDVIYDFGCGASDIARRARGGARRVGRRTQHLAEDIGPVRGLIGLAILGAAIGGTIYLVRYVRQRRAEQLVDVQPAGVESNLPGMEPRSPYQQSVY